MRSGLLLSLLVLAPSVTAAQPAGAQTQPSSNAFQASKEERARGEVSELLRTLCPEQCVLVSVEAKIDTEPLGEPVPGFQTPDEAATQPVLRSLRAHVLADSSLPQAFRTKLEGLVMQRLRALGAPARVTVESVAFPPRPSTAPPAAAPAPQPQIITVPIPMPAAPPAPAAAPATGVTPAPASAATPAAPESTLLRDALLVLGLGLMACVTLLVLGAMFLRFAATAGSRSERGQSSRTGDSAEATARTGGMNAPLAEERAAVRARLQRLLGEGALPAVLEAALAGGEAGLVATWLRELGPELLRHLEDAGDLSAFEEVLAPALKSGPSSAADAVSALHTLEARLLAAMVTSPRSDAPFAFLHGASSDAFCAAVEQLGEEERSITLNHAPATLRDAALSRMSPAQRLGIAAAWTRSHDAARIAHAATSARQALQSAAKHVRAERSLAEVVIALPRAEQEQVVDALRRSGSARVEELVTEELLERASADVISAVFLSTPLQALVAYLSSTPPASRNHLVGACPPQLQRELNEELHTRAPAQGQEATDARRLVLRQLDAELKKRGLSPRSLRAGRAAERAS